jgi:hypothetical protein
MDFRPFEYCSTPEFMTHPGDLISSVVVLLLGLTVPPQALGESTVNGEAELAKRVPSGKAEAYFALDSGADQMTTNRKEARLIVIVRFGSTELRHIIASCGHPSLGSALGGVSDTVLEVAYCNGEYRLLSEAGKVLVQQQGAGKRLRIVTTIPLPAGTTQIVKP